jgi:hypothetical protein
MVIQAFGLLQARRVLPFVTFEVTSGVGGSRERERDSLHALWSYECLLIEGS